jgi:SAM-dependent methyltransferase
VEVDLHSIYAFVERASASLESGAWVLDAGAGEGRYRALFARAHYIGVDLAVGDTKWDYGGLDALCDLVRLPFGQGAFGAVLCTQVLEHVPEPLQVLEEVARVLKPGGHLFLSVPQSWPQHQKPYDFYRYTSFGLRYLVERAGLRVESMRSMGGYFWYLSVQLQNINHWLFPRQMWGRRLTWPLRALFGLVFQLALPLLLYYLDPLDRAKDQTCGYLCVAVRPTEADEDPA